MAIKDQHFDQFRELLLALDTDERQGTHKECFVEFPDGTVYTLVQALQGLPEQELESRGGFNTDQTGYWPIFLDIYGPPPEKPKARYSKVLLIKEKWLLEMEAQDRKREQERQAAMQAAIAQGARYFLVEFAQRGENGPLYVRAVLSSEGYQDKAVADTLAEEAEAAAFAREHFNCRIVARLAHDYGAARQGRFLDE